MKYKTFSLFFVILISLVLSTLVFAASYDFTESESITCGNGFCEHMSIHFESIGEEVQASIAGETYRIKIIEVIDKGDGTYSVVLNVNGEEVTSEVQGDESRSKDIIEKFGFNVDASPITKNKLVIDVHEPYINNCAVPDCDSRIKLDVYKKWNMVPILFLSGPGGTGIKGTCTLKDFLVIYGYNPVKKEYDQVHSYGKNANDLKNSLMSVGEQGISERGIVVSTGWNSVWVYSLSECNLTADIPKSELNLLSRIAEVKAQGMKVNFASGWNFWTASKDMEGKSFDDIKGNCEIEKAYAFEAQNQSWKKLETPPGLATNFLFKVKNTCMFAEKIPEIPDVPAIPDAPAVPEAPGELQDQCVSGSECNDNDACTIDNCTGTPKECKHIQVNTCFSGDSCCPVNCMEENDSDCGTTEEPELKTCSELNGGICSPNQTCSTDYVTASDSTLCCLGNCSECTAHSECDDGDSSTNDVCDLQTFQCSNEQYTCTQLLGTICQQNSVCYHGTTISPDSVNALTTTEDTPYCCIIDDFSSQCAKGDLQPSGTMSLDVSSETYKSIIFTLLNSFTKQSDEAQATVTTIEYEVYIDGVIENTGTVTDEQGNVTYFDNPSNPAKAYVCNSCEITGHNVKIIIDPANKITEENESNNTIEEIIQ